MGNVLGVSLDSNILAEATRLYKGNDDAYALVTILQDCLQAGRLTEREIVLAVSVAIYKHRNRW